MIFLEEKKKISPNSLKIKWNSEIITNAWAQFVKEQLETGLNVKSN